MRRQVDVIPAMQKSEPCEIAANASSELGKSQEAAESLGILGACGSHEDSPSKLPVTRRSFVGRAAVALAGLSAGSSASARQDGRSTTPASTFLDLLRIPDEATAYTRGKDPLPLTRVGSEWHGNGVDVETRVSQYAVKITLSAPEVPVKFVHLRWNVRGWSIPAKDNLLALGDHWERSYGDLGWRNMIPERVMPWYFTTYDGSACHAYGVQTGARSLCFWQLDPQGVSLWLNTSNGGEGVQLGQRVLVAATVVTRQGASGEDPTDALRDFCRRLCAQPSLRAQPIYGTNDWYYAYGKNTAQRILSDTEFIAGLADSNKVRPFSVVDMGWVDGSKSFPSMAQLAQDIRARKVRPGVWIRPLEAPENSDSRLMLPNIRFGERKQPPKGLTYDPTIPEAQERIAAKVKQVVAWEFELIKHDFSTYDLLGQWGFEMGAEPTLPGWSLNDRSKTNAEVIFDLYRLIRESSRNQAPVQETLILGCNTVGHLGQGFFNIQRTGDDTSGRRWERTRRMGINTLAFRLPQHESFFVQDADCVGISDAIPWQQNRQWLDLLARTGTALFISPGEGSRGREQAQAIEHAFALTASGGAGARPITWREESTPQEWTSTAGGGNAAASSTVQYDWCAPNGAYPFHI